MTGPEQNIPPEPVAWQGDPPSAAKNWVRDLVERVVTTFLAGFLGAVSLDLTQITSLGWKAWLVAGAGAGVVSVVKGLVARGVGSSGSASLDPKNVG